MQICREHSTCDEAVDMLHLERSEGGRGGKTLGKKYTFRFKFCMQVIFRLGWDF